MTDRSLQDLADVTDAAFRVEQARLRQIGAEEMRLRSELAQLDDQIRTNVGLSAQGGREIGADMLWQGWVRRMRGDLQSRLAMVLVRKSAMIAAMRTAHGRKIAAENLLEKQLALNAKAQRKTMIEQEQSLIMCQQALQARRNPDQMS